MIGPDAVACLCRELSASTGKHIGKIMDQICASQVDTQDDMQNSVHNTGSLRKTAATANESRVLAYLCEQLTQ